MDMFEHAKTVVDGVYKWTVKDDKVEPPVHKFPKEVKERIDYFWDMAEDGMTFMGAMECIFADEKPVDYDWGASKDWLPKSEAFSDWVNQLPGMSQMEIAIYMIYGNYKEEKNVDD